MTRKKGELVKTSDFVKKEINRFEEDIINAIVEKSGITPEQAIEYLQSDEAWQQLMENKKKALDLDLLDLVQDFKESIKAKIEKGSMEQAKSGMVGISIAYDKLFGKDEKKSSLKIEGTNVQVNMPFKFRSYNDKKGKK